MSLSTKRMGGSVEEPHTFEVQTMLPGASTLLWHVSRLKGMRVIAKKSAPMTDDFEAYFIYKDRLFLMQTPFARIWVSLLGQLPDETLFAEVEKHVQQYSHALSILVPFAVLRYLLMPYNPSGRVYAESGVKPPNLTDG